MQTPWGEIPVHDAHVHFFSHRFFNLLAGSTEGLGARLGWELPPESPLSLAARWVEEMDRHGVSRISLIASLPGDEASVAAAVEAYPERFSGYFIVNPTAPRWEAGFDLRLSVPCLFPAMHRYSLHDDRVAPVFERAKVVFIHCGVLSVGVRKKLGMVSLFDMRYSNPLDVHMLALRHPKVKFVIPHFGSGMFREALMLCDLCPNVSLDTSSSNGWMKYQDAGCDLKNVFSRALAVAGPKRLIFGTDSSFFPRGWNNSIFEVQASILRDLGVSKEDAEAIFGGNLKRLLDA